MELTTIENNLTLLDIAKNPAAYQPEVKAAALSTLKQMKAQIRDIEIMIASNVIHEMVQENATKILFKDTAGEDHTLTLKSAPKKLNPGIKTVEEFAIENGFPNLIETKVIPVSWSECKELRKQGGKIQEVIDRLYIEGSPTVEIK
jgi:hypothetical protein